jgi:sec-independent protein translocase protein TatA
MFNFSFPELVLVLAIALVVFGPGKLPELGKALGKGIGEFKGALSESAKESTGQTTPTIPENGGEAVKNVIVKNEINGEK